MNKREKIIEDLYDLDTASMLDFDSLAACIEYMKEMEQAMTTFVERVDKGEVQSKRTYAQFKTILDLD